MRYEILTREDLQKIKKNTTFIGFTFPTLVEYAIMYGKQSINIKYLSQKEREIAYYKSHLFEQEIKKQYWSMKNERDHYKRKSELMR